MQIMLWWNACLCRELPTGASCTISPKCPRWQDAPPWLQPLWRKHSPHLKITNRNPVSLQKPCFKKMKELQQCQGAQDWQQLAAHIPRLLHECFLDSNYLFWPSGHTCEDSLGLNLMVFGHGFHVLLFETCVISLQIFFSKNKKYWVFF